MKNWNYQNFTVYQFDELDSTNSHAAAMANAGKLFDREIVMANCQNAGRGRMDRAWASPKGNLYFSLLLREALNLKDVGQISFLAIVALRLAIEGLVDGLLPTEDSSLKFDAEPKVPKVDSSPKLNTKPKIENKWPNDLLLDEKKLAGILLESKFNQEKCEFVVLGIGVNIASSPDNTIFPATNLAHHNIKITPENLLREFLAQFEILYQNWLSFGFQNVRKAWLSKAYRLKEEIVVKVEGKEIKGVFEDLDVDGALILKVEGDSENENNLGNDGLKKIFYGDIS